jgi:hypothetical protein
MKTHRLAVPLLLLLATAVPAAARSYAADRFDVDSELRADGSQQLSETVVFRFEGGPFTWVAREMPSRRVDAIESFRRHLKALSQRPERMVDAKRARSSAFLSCS